MLARLHHAGCSLTRVYNRGYASTPDSVYPFKKLRALPFVMTPEAAQRKMANHAQLLCGGKYHLRSQIVPHIPPELNHFFKFEFKRPTIFFAAAYFPAWLISGGFETQLMFPDERVIKAYYLSSLAYIPGSDVSTISAASLWPDGVEYIDRLVPYKKDLLRQFDMDVEAIPFNVSPFAFLDVIKSSPDPGITFEGGGRVIPETVHVSSFTAMPVLLPLYVATYEDERHNSGNFLTMFIQAHSNEGLIKADQRHVLEFLSLNDFKVEDVPENYSLIEGQDVCDIDGRDDRTLGYMEIILNIGCFDMEFHPREIEVEMMKRFGNNENIRKLASMASIDNDDDERIREMTVDQVLAVQDWVREMKQKIKKTYEINPNQPNPSLSKKDVWAKYGAVQAKKGRKKR
ncbi:hypothetical protein CPB84DRAFT_1764257 [Gymnopilus junonius]|uniref:Uncharacterized protein n=1 Tax=Gymnopilus junonius TaxID=109634 RepID=A0A9P5P150_GYMJU|nr:hypothetical protein CPB84DRAFT_1764257 [Gymnopilus junonius]